MILQKHARSNCEITPLLRAGFCIMLQNYGLPAYLEFFIAVFRIAQSYKVSYKVIGDAEIDQKLTDLDAVRRMKNFEQGQYAEFGLELMSESAGAGARKRIAREFLESRLIKSLSRKDWKDILDLLRN